MKDEWEHRILSAKTRLNAFEIFKIIELLKNAAEFGTGKL